MVLFYFDQKNVSLNMTTTLMAFTGVTNAHGSSLQPTACRSPTLSLTTATGSNQAQGNV